jgi:hypothetical protein
MINYNYYTKTLVILVVVFVILKYVINVHLYDAILLTCIIITSYLIIEKVLSLNNSSGNPTNCDKCTISPKKENFEAYNLTDNLNYNIYGNDNLNCNKEVIAHNGINANDKLMSSNKDIKNLVYTSMQPTDYLMQPTPIQSFPKLIQPTPNQSNLIQPTKMITKPTKMMVEPDLPDPSYPKLTQPTYDQSYPELTQPTYNQSYPELTQPTYDQSFPELTQPTYEQSFPELTQTSYEQSFPELTQTSYDQSFSEYDDTYDNGEPSLIDVIGNHIPLELLVKIFEMLPHIIELLKSIPMFSKYEHVLTLLQSPELLLENPKVLEFIQMLIHIQNSPELLLENPKVVEGLNYLNNIQEKVNYVMTLKHRLDNNEHLSVMIELLKSIPMFSKYVPALTLLESPVLIASNDKVMTFVKLLLESPGVPETLIQNPNIINGLKYLQFLYEKYNQFNKIKHQFENNKKILAIANILRSIPMFEKYSYAISLLESVDTLLTSDSIVMDLINILLNNYKSPQSLAEDPNVINGLEYLNTVNKNKTKPSQQRTHEQKNRQEKLKHLKQLQEKQQFNHEKKQIIKEPMQQKSSLFDSKNSSLTNGRNSSLTDGKNSSLTNGRNSSLTDGKNLSLTDGRNSSLTDGKNSSLTDGKNSSLTDGKNSSLTDGKNSSLTDGNEYSSYDVNLYRLNAGDKRLTEQFVRDGNKYYDSIFTRSNPNDQKFDMNSELRYGDLNYLAPLNKGMANKDYTFISPNNWFPIPPVPPVCVTNKNCTTCPIIMSDGKDYMAWADVNDFDKSRRFTGNMGINIDYVKNVLNDSNGY